MTTKADPPADNEELEFQSQKGRKTKNSLKSRDKSQSNKDQISFGSFTSPNTYINLRDENDEPWECKMCDNVFDDPEAKLLECERFCYHFCTRCLGKPDKEYELLKNSDYMWFCGECKEKVERNIVVDRDIEQRCSEYMAKMENRMTKIEQEMKTKCDKNSVIKIANEEIKKSFPDETKIKNLVRSEIDSKLKRDEEIVQEMTQKVIKSLPNTHVRPEASTSGEGADGGSSAVGAASATKDELISSVMTEVNERKLREKNIIICGLDESSSNLKDVKRKYDMSLFKQIADKCEVQKEDDDINKIIRLGKPEQGKSRPLQIVMEEVDKKQELFANLNKLKDAPDNIRKISVTNDLTKKERDEIRALNEEAKRRTPETEGETVYKVRGPPWRIVRMGKRD